MTSEGFGVVDDGPSIESREVRLVEGADALGAGSWRKGWLGADRVLITVAASLMTIGILLVLLGWLGAAKSTVLEEQVPYLISGGLLGVALSVVGAVCLLAHWLTVLIREVRSEHAELMEALRAMTSDEGRGNGRARSTGSQRSVRRTARSR